MNLDGYSLDNFFDEMIDTSGDVKDCYRLFAEKFKSMDEKELERRQYAAEKAFMVMGATFNVYKEGAGIEKILPFDIIPSNIFREYILC